MSKTGTQYTTIFQQKGFNLNLLTPFHWNKVQLCCNMFKFFKTLGYFKPNSNEEYKNKKQVLDTMRLC